MKVRRIVVFLAALLAFTATAPSAAAYRAGTASSSGGAFETSRSEPAPHHDAAPKLSVLATLHRVSVAAPGGARRFGDPGARIVALGPAATRVEGHGAVAGVDDEADARLLRASNTPCCVRGPPAAA